MKMKKLVSAAIAALMLATFCLPAYAADTEKVPIENYYSTSYTAESAKVATMELKYTSTEYGWAMYFDTQSGEFALKNLKTGEYTFSNPYDIAVGATTNEAHRQALMSQIILSYTEIETKTTSILNSFAAAAMNGQITFKALTNGVRVEYAIGTVESKRLIPRQIEKDRFTENIYNVLKERSSEMTKDEKFIFDHLLDTYYKLIDQTDPENASLVDAWRDKDTGYACLANNHEMIIYVLQQADNRSLKNVETLIRKYCPNYTYDDLEYDHELTMYEGDEKEPALFRLAIEYTIDKYGLSASVPSKSIRYNETNYTLENIILLPYFGCASTKNSGVYTRTGGYLFIPDGSGTLLQFYNDDGTVKTGSQGSAIYGADYTYENLSSATVNTNKQTYRLPVFGLVRNFDETVTTERSGRSPKVDIVSHSRGWLAVVSEGESFTSVIANLGQVTGVTGGGSCEYDYVCASFSTKQSDTVSLGSSLGSDTSLSTSIDTKYLGNYTLRFLMLTDPVAAAKAGVTDYYYPSYVGMANAYRNYLISNGEMEKLTSDEIEGSLPLYINSFGYTTVKETFLTFPVSVKKPLTTFEDIQTMCETLKESKITNLRIILTEYGATINKAKWKSVSGGSSGFKKLMQYANENGVIIFPDYNFTAVTYNDIRAGFSLKKYGAQTMSGRYSTKRSYDFIFQMVTQFGRRNIVSASAFDTIYSKFSKSFLKLGTNAISVQSLGMDLNSDFNEDFPLTREDSKYYTEEFMKKLKADNENVLVSSGNAYTLPYITDVIDLPLDNSGYAISSASVPFTGMVLHGYVNYAGTAMNLEGDVRYQLLKSLENGAALYFILSYQNTDKLKSAYGMLSEYFSVNFSMWLPDVIKYYTELNNAIGNLQSATITSHSFVQAFKLDETTADMMFETYNALKSVRDSARADYEKAIANVDRLIADQKDATEAIAVEAAKLVIYNTAKAAFEQYKSSFERHLADGVVSVTYTTDSGKQKTFYINYNSFDAVIETENGGVFTLPATSFVESADITGNKSNASTYSAATAYKPTSGELASYETVSENLAGAIASGNENQIARYKLALDKLTSSMAVQSNVLKITCTDGSTVYINTTTNNALVKTGDYEYVTIAGQSYKLINN